MNDAVSRHLPRRLLLASALLTPGCGILNTSSPENTKFLPQLREDPLAAKDLLGLKLIREHEQGFSTGMTNKPSFTEVSRTFEIDPTQRDTIFAATCRIAHEAGWEDKHDPPGDSTTSWFGKKVSPPRTCSVTINSQDAITLQIRLVNHVKLS